MEDHELDTLLADASRTYRVAPTPPLDPMWASIEARAYAPVPRAIGWRTFSVGIAAALLLGVLGGRLSVRPDPQPLADASARADRSSDDPYGRATEEVLGKSAMLLTAVRMDATSDDARARLAAQASELLGTTRLLIDSPVGGDAQLRTLLQDLELVLAQVSRLAPGRSRTELPMITAAVEQHELVPRIRSAVVELTATDY